MVKRARVTVWACVCVCVCVCVCMCVWREVYFPAPCGCCASSVKWKTAFWHLLHSDTQENKFPHKTTLFPHTYTSTHTRSSSSSSSSSSILLKSINIRHEEVAEKWKSRLSCWSCLLLWNFPGNLPFQSFSPRDERVVEEAGGVGVLSIAGQSSTLKLSTLRCFFSGVLSPVSLNPYATAGRLEHEIIWGMPSGKPVSVAANNKSV